MPQRSWSAKRERQYEHIKDSATDRGEPEDRAEDRRPYRQQGNARRPARRERRQNFRARTCRPVGVVVNDRTQRCRRTDRDQLAEEAQRKKRQGPVDDDQGPAATSS